MILYLDIDGVLNNRSERSIKNCYGDFDKPYNDLLDLRTTLEKYHHLDPDKYHTHLINLDIELCDRLQTAVLNLINFSDTFEIVICSTWRKMFMIDELKYLFILKGFGRIAKYFTRCINPPEYIYDYADKYIDEGKYNHLVKIDCKVNNADLEVLFDLLKHNIVENFLILSDDISALRNNIYEDFMKGYKQ